ncbi:hypothetical protein DMENIID0001_005120 [Sergentomyia squamirostris]
MLVCDDGDDDGEGDGRQRDGAPGEAADDGEQDHQKGVKMTEDGVEEEGESEPDRQKTVKMLVCDDGDDDGEGDGRQRDGAPGEAADDGEQDHQKGVKVSSSALTKRGLNREKYSPGYDDWGYPESGMMTPTSVASCYPKFDYGRKNSTTSMTSSITSESGFSDKYDPFVSAKRQLEELFSPPSQNSSSKKSTTTPTTSKIPAKSPLSAAKTTLVSPTSQLSQLKASNFRRTSSLRMPKKASPPKSFYPSRPTESRIQRGISDEGPISTNFVKPEVYDETPVKSVYAADFGVKKSPAQTPLASRKNLRLELKKTNLPASDFPIAKTDSLAVFLNYERDLNTSKPSMSEKELKDKSNSLRSQQKSEVASPEVSEMQIRPMRLAPLVLEKTPKLTPVTLNQILKPSTRVKMDRSTFIDPKLINLRDNLPMNVGTVSSADSSETVSSSGSREPSGKIPDNRTASNNQRNHETMVERPQTPLKRQQKIECNNILHDMASKEAQTDSPTDPYSDAYDQTIELLDSSEAKKIPVNFDEFFNDFDFEEFLTNFEDDEQYPLFRDYKKDLMINRQRRMIGREKSGDDLTHLQRSSPEECREKCDREEELETKCGGEERKITAQPKEFHQEGAEAFEEYISSPEIPSPMDPIDTNYAEKTKTATTPKQRDSFDEAEQQLLQSCRELDLMCAPESSIFTDSGYAAKSTGSATPVGQDSPKMCRFCHECGSRFLVDTAKFCMECGVRRITI